MKKLITFLFASFALVSCTNAKKSTVLGDQNAGKSITGWYYYHVMQENFDSIPKLMNDEFFNADQQAAFVKDLKLREEKYGKIKSFELDEWELTDKNKKEKTKDFVFEYKVKYENSEATEKIYLEKKGNDLKISKVEYED